MKADGICGVSWCPALKRQGREVCDFHAERPVLHSLEKHDDYMARIRREDAGSGARRRPTADAEPAPLITDDTPSDPNVARPGWAS